MLQNSKVQNSITQTLVKELSQKLNTKVSVGEVHIKLLNRLVINDFYIEDQQKDTLLYVDKVNAHFNLGKLFNKKITIHSAEFQQLFGNIILNYEGKPNFDFIIQAFKKPKTTQPQKFEFNIQRFELKNSSFRYTSQKNYQPLPKDKFNIHQFQFDHINGEVAVNVAGKDNVSGSIKKFSGIEKSGFQLKNISSNFHYTNQSLQFPFLDIELPNSMIHLDSLQFDYPKTEDLKNFNDKVHLKIPLHSSYVSPSDFSAFVPSFKNINGKFFIDAETSGKLSSMHFKNIQIKYGDSFSFTANVDLNGLPDFNETFIYADINDLHFKRADLQDFIADLTKRPVILPSAFNQIGTIRYKGNISGFFNNLVAYGKLKSDVGEISTDVLFRFGQSFKEFSYDGTFKTPGLKLDKILNNPQFGNLIFNINTQGTKKENNDFQGIIEASVPEFQWKSYSYNNMIFNGNYSNSGFNGTFEMVDDNIATYFNGIIDLTQQSPTFDFHFKLSHADLNALNLVKKYPLALLSFDSKINMVGNPVDQLNGTIDVDNIQFTNHHKALNVQKIQLTSRQEPDFTSLIISSDFVNGYMNGRYNYNTLPRTFKKLIQYYLPSLSFDYNSSTSQKPNYFNVDLQISNIKELTEVLQIPYTLKENSIIKGFVDERNNTVNLTADFPFFQKGESEFKNTTLLLQTENQQLQLTTNTQLKQKNGFMNIYLKALAGENVVSTLFAWQNTDSIKNAGEFQTVTQLRKENNKTFAQLSILPAQVIISNSLWNIHPSTLDFKPDGSICVHNFLFDNDQSQYIQINGIASKNQDDALEFKLKGVDFSFIMNDLVKLKALSLGGFFTGEATLYSALYQPFFEAKMFVKDYQMNHVILGDADLLSYWDKENKQIYSEATIVDKKDTVATIEGAYIPGKDSIDFIYDLHRISVEMLKPYLGSVVQNVKGFATGKLRMFGPTKKMGFHGDLFMEKAQVTMFFTNTTYFFNDTIHMRRYSTEFKNITISDEDGNRGTLNGKLIHNGMFGDLTYNVTVTAKNLLSMNTHPEDNPIFYGKIYADGVVHVFGDENVTNLFVNAVSKPHTECNINIPTTATASESNFVNFVKKETDIEKEKKIETTIKSESTSNTKVNIQIEVTPDAEIRLIVDPRAGDMIEAKGSGNLRFEFDNYSDIKVFGTYIIEKGNYLLTLQNIIRKEFKILEGSTMSWTGNPYNAQINVRGIYSLTASLRDLLDESQLMSIPRTTVPVNCILLMTGDLMSPTINFDIDLPSSDESVKQLVKSIINTKEMMARQIVYLLIFNKFYNPYLQQTTNAPIGIGSSEAISFLTSTVSAQLNNLLSQMINSNIISIGIDYQQSESSSSNVQTQVLIQPNDRLIINGNLGYRNDNINLSTNTNKFIGDVDIEWLLTENGKFRLKAYNHTIDRYQLRAAKNTQGIGFMYKADFESFEDLFKYYWQKITFKKDKSSNEKNNE